MIEGSCLQEPTTLGSTLNLKFNVEIAIAHILKLQRQSSGYLHVSSSAAGTAGDGVDAGAGVGVGLGAGALQSFLRCLLCRIGVP